MNLVEELGGKINLSLNRLKEDLSGIRSGRPNAGLIENIKVECYGQQMAIKQIALIGILPPRQLSVQPWDESVTTDILKAIEADVPGASAVKDEKAIKVNLPELSEERKKEFTKRAKQLAEECRIEIRRLREDAKKEIQNLLEKKEVTEDEKFKLINNIQKKVDEANDKVEEMLRKKIKELEE